MTAYVIDTNEAARNAAQLIARALRFGYRPDCFAAELREQTFAGSVEVGTHPIRLARWRGDYDEVIILRDGVATFACHWRGRVCNRRVWTSPAAVDARMCKRIDNARVAVALSDRDGLMRELTYRISTTLEGTYLQTFGANSTGSDAAPGGSSDDRSRSISICFGEAGHHTTTKEQTTWVH